MDKFMLKMTLLILGFLAVMMNIFSGYWHHHSVIVGMLSVLYIQWMGRMVTGKKISP